MDYAIEPGSQKHVRPSTATRGRFYRCPVCRADVFLKKGRRRDSHFAHRPGQGTDACELYYPAAGISGPVVGLPSSQDSEPHPTAIPALQLGIELEPETTARRARPRRWGLCLSVPQADTEHGQFKIDCGPAFPTRPVTLANLRLGSACIPVDPEGDDFGANWISPEVRPRYRAAIEGRVEGLFRQGITPFSTGTQKAKTRAAHLSWGERYYFVWRDGGAVEIPDALSSVRLASMGLWACALVSLPDEGDEDLRLWLERLCDCPVARPRSRWGILYPATYTIDVHGRIVVPETDRILLALESADEGPLKSTTISFQVAGARTVTVLPASGRQIVELIQPQSTEPLGLRWRDTELPALVRSVEASDNAPAVAFEFLERSNGSLQKANFHDRTCERLLQNVRDLQADIAALQIPHGVEGSVWWRVHGTFAWNKERLGGEHGATEYGTTVTGPAHEFISRLLQNPLNDIHLSFFGFGAFHSLGRLAPSPTASATALALPQSVRRRIEWLCQTVQYFPRGEHARFAALTDDELLAHFQAARIPAPLAAHKQAIDIALPLAPRRTS